MKYICPLITVSDLERSRYFYEKVLNQKVKYDFGESITFYGDFSIHVESHYHQLINQHKIKYGGNNFELYFEENNIEEIEKHLKQNCVEFLHETREQPWRQKVIRIYDPDQNIIEIGESLGYLAYRLSKESLTEDNIAHTINMNVDFVRSSIQSFNKIS